MVEIGPPNKKCKAAAPIPLTASNIAAASSSSGVFSVGGPAIQHYSASLSISSSSGTMPPSNGGGAEYTPEERQQGEAEEEYVCAIRPVDASFPHTGGSQLFSSLLSTASIVAHDLDLRSSNSDFPFQPHCTFSPPSSSQINQSQPQSYQPKNAAPGSCPSHMYSSMSTILSAAPDIVNTDMYLESGSVLDVQPL